MATRDPSWAEITDNPGMVGGPGTTVQQPGGPSVANAAPAGATGEDDLDFDLPRLKRMFDDARQTLQNSRVDSELSRDYYDGPKQLSPEMLAILRARRQPEIWINRIRGAVDGVVGVIDSNHVDPRAYPVEPGDDDASDVASDTLRYTSQQNHFNVIKADCLENGLIEGCYAAIIEGGPNQDVSVTQVRWDEFFYDPRSRRADFLDARYLGIAKWMYADQLGDIFPSKKAEFGAFAYSGDASSVGVGDLTWEDKPENAFAWLDGTRRRVMVVEVYHLNGGKWFRSVFCAVGVLEHGISAYQDDKGNPACPIIAGSCYVSRENQRYGIVRDMRPIQDEINMRRQKLLHELNVRQIRSTSPDSPPVNVDTVRTEAARADGVIPLGWDIVQRNDVVEGQVNLLNEAKTEIERMGPNPAILGRQGADASGRADQIRQAAGMTELQRVLGRFADWELRCYKQMWAVQRQFWSAPKWIRVTGDENAPKYIQINTVEQPGVPQVNPQTGQPVVGPDGQPVWQTPPVIKNHLAEMDVDIVVDTVPDTASLEQEVWQELIRLIGTNPTYAQQVPFELAIEMSPLPRKRQLIQKIEANKQQNAQQIEQAASVAQGKAFSEQFKTESEAVKNFALAAQARVEGVATAVTAHIDIAEAEMLEEQYQMGTPGIPGLTPTAADVTPPPQPPAPQPGATPPT